MTPTTYSAKAIIFIGIFMLLAIAVNSQTIISCLSGLDTWPQNTVPRSVPSVPPFSLFCAKFRTPKAD